MKEELERLRKKWIAATKSLQKWNDLYSKREELEKHETQLLQELQSEELSFYQKKSDEFDDKTSFSRKKAELLSNVRHKKREVDNLLDSLEEFTDQNVENLRQQVIEAILQEHSENRAFVFSLQGELAKKEAYQQELTQDTIFMTRLIKLLEIVAQARLTVKRQGLLSYIFGSNPNVTISQHLHAADELIALSLPSFEQREIDTLGGQQLSSLYQKLIIQLKEFQNHSKKTWGFKHIDQIVANALDNFRELEQQFEEKLTESNRQKQELTDQLNSFILKFNL